VENEESGLLECSFCAIADVCATACHQSVHGEYIDMFLEKSVRLLQGNRSAQEKCLAYECLSRACLKAPTVLHQVMRRKALVDTWFCVENDNDTLVSQISAIGLAIFCQDVSNDAGLEEARKSAFKRISDVKSADCAQVIVDLMQQKNKQIKFAVYELISSAANLSGLQSI